MANRSFSKGSLSQMVGAFENKLEELGGASTGVTSATEPESGFTRQDAMEYLQLVRDAGYDPHTVEEFTSAIQEMEPDFDEDGSVCTELWDILVKNNIVSSCQTVESTHPGDITEEDAQFIADSMRDEGYDVTSREDFNSYIMENTGYDGDQADKIWDILDRGEIAAATNTSNIPAKADMVMEDDTQSIYGSKSPDLDFVDAYVDLLAEKIRNHIDDGVNLSRVKHSDKEINLTFVADAGAIYTVDVPFEELTLSIDEEDVREDCEYILVSVRKHQEEDAVVESSMKTPMAFECPACGNTTVYDVAQDAFRAADVGEGDQCVCDECGAEFVAHHSFDGLTFQYSED